METTILISAKFFTTVKSKDHQIARPILFVGGPNSRTTNQRWRTAAILRIKKSRYLCNDFIMEIGEAIKNPAYRIFQTEYSGCLDISAHA